MSIITDYLINYLRGHLDRHHVVVWYDPRDEYSDAIARLDAAETLGGARLVQYDPRHGYLQLRRDLEPHWAAEQPPRLLLYVADRRPPGAAAPLLEYEAAGAALWPGAHPAERDSALAPLARRALQGHLPDARIAQLADQLEADPPQLTYAELERSIDQGKTTGVLDVLYPGAASPADLVLAFLNDPGRDEGLGRRRAVGQMARLLEQTLGARFTETEPEALRAAAARRILLTELAATLPALSPPIPPAKTAAARAAAVQLAAAWRDRQPMAESYERHARTVEAEGWLAARLRELDPDWPSLAATHTFPAAEARLQSAVAAALPHGPAAPLVALADARRHAFWATRSPAGRARWNAILSAGRLLLQVERVRAGLRARDLSAAALWQAYVTGRDGPPWCLLDRYQRHFERDVLAVDLDDPDHDALLRLAAHARDAYAEAAGELAERFVRAYEAAAFALPASTPQTDIYVRHVRPRLADGPVAYILVDAFRYEMAHELQEQLAQLEAARRPQLLAATATPPTITEVGMAALLPGAESGLILASARDKLQVSLPGATLPDRQARVEQFGRAVDPPWAVAKLHELAPLSDKKLQAQIQAAKIVLVTATEEIDTLCESVPNQARQQLDGVFEQLRRALGALFRQGIRTAVITADHGHLFLDRPLSPAELIARPGGQPVVEKRRVWVGRGGNTPPGVLRTPLAAFGLAGETGERLELLTPYRLAAFKAPGSGAIYFHGGLSLPELALPVLTVRAAPSDTPIEMGRFNWTLRPGSATISARVLTVDITAESTDLMPPAPPRLNVEVRVGDRVVSALIGADEGFHERTGDIETAIDPANPRRLRPHSAVLQIRDELEPDDTSASIVLLDATTGIQLARLDNVAITIAI